MKNCLYYFTHSVTDGQNAQKEIATTSHRKQNQTADIAKVRMESPVLVAEIPRSAECKLVDSSETETNQNRLPSWSM